MEVCQVTQEQQCREVKEARDADQYLEFDKQYCLVGIFLTFNGRFRLCRQIVEHKDVGNIMRQGQQEDHNDQSEEKNVVRFAHTIVQPSAVVVEFVDAAIARTTVLGCGMYMSFTNVAFELVVGSVKNAAITTK